MTKRARHWTGLAVIALSVLALLPCIFAALAPPIAHLFFHGHYSLTANTGAIQEGLALAMFGGGGLVGGIWMVRGK